MFKKSFWAFGLLAFIFYSCDNDDNTVIENEQETITTLNLTLTPQGGVGSSINYSFQDLDGEGGNMPTIEVADLEAGTIYDVTVELLDETDSEDVENITLEIEEEDDEHQFFYSSTIEGLEFAYSDQDDNQNPIGLQFTITTPSSGSTDGSITITLIHEPNKDAEGVSGNDITNAGGETDIQVTFSSIDIISL